MPDGNENQEHTQQNGEQQNQQSSSNPGNGTGTNAGNEGEDKRFTQAQLDAAIKERLDRERKGAADKAAKDKADADAQTLKEQLKFQELADRHEARVKELEPTVEALTAERDTLAKHLTEIVAAETKDWPKEVKDLLPAEDAGVLARYEAVARTRPLAERLGGTDTRQRGNGPGPKPNGAAGQQTSETIVEQKRASGMYSPF